MGRRRRLALALPETSEGSSHDGVVAWRVKDRLFVWERPLRRADLQALGEAAPSGLILGVRVPDLGAKEALLAGSARRLSHDAAFDGYPAVLVRLDDISRR